MGLKIIALFWGFAEGTLFFIVPDVWLSIVGRDNLQRGIHACFYSLAGALVGGLLMYLWGTMDLETVRLLLAKIPAINLDMMVRVNYELNSQGPTAILFGPLSGTPYKLYAIFSAKNGIELFDFILISIPARLVRFLLVTVISHFLLKGIQRFINIDQLKVLLLGWIAFYLFYFFTM